MNSSKSKKILVYVIMGLLSLAGIYSEFVVFTFDTSFFLIVELVFTCAMFVLIAYYAVANFKIPHGNLLKYLFLAFSAMAFVGILTTGLSGGKLYFYQIARGFVIITSAYIAGRLDRIKQNTIIIIIDAILLFATSLENIVDWGITEFTPILFFSNFFIMWLDLMIAYLFRYHSHKEAGLADK